MVGDKIADLLNRLTTVTAIARIEKEAGKIIRAEITSEEAFYPRS
jgi:hypothetical protein